MKIVCGSCQAKYSIADEKVAGKVFKIRCKRCSEVIVVRGDQEEHVPSEHPPADASSEAIWHVVINGEQAGPFAPSQLAEMMTAGKLDWEAYVWTEGFENWLPMRDVPELVTAISGPQDSEPQAQPEPVRAAVGAPAYSTAQPSMGADPFADDGPTTALGGFAQSAAQPAARSNLFVASGGAAESPFEAAESRVVASAPPSPRVSASQAMTGARNENSVLFSLKNLQALATGSSVPSAPSNHPAAARPGFAGGEGSGLIDIRALATATGVNDQGKNASEKDALLSLGSAQAGAFGALGSPMLAPPARDDETSKKGLVIAIIGGFALLAVAGVTAAVILRPGPSAAPPMAPIVAAPVAPAPAAAPQPSAAAPTTAAEPPSEGELAAQRAAKPAPAAAAPSGTEPARPQHGASSKREKAPAEEAKPAAAAPKPEAAPAPKKSGGSSLDDLLDNAIGGSKKPAASAAAAPAASNLPDKPSRDDVLNAMNGIKGEVSGCAKGQTGVAFANITVAGKTGRVSNVEVTGMTGEVGSCIARVVRKASFPKFKSDSFQVKFPFRI